MADRSCRRFRFRPCSRTHPQAPSRRRRPHLPRFEARDRGATAIGYAGVTVLVCTMGIALLGVTDHGRRVLAEVERAVCGALDLGGCPPRRGGTDDLLPQACATDARDITAATGVSVAAGPSGRVRIGERTNSDGTAEVALTQALGGTTDAPSPFRWGVGAGPLAEAEAGVGAGVHGEAAATRTWTFPNGRQADRFRERVARSEHLENLGQDSGAFDALGAQFVGLAGEWFGSDAHGGLPPPDRREVSVTGGAHLDGGAGAAVGLGRDGPHASGSTGGSNDVPAPIRDEPPARPADSNEGVTSDLGLLELVSAGADGDAVLSSTTDDRNDTVSQTIGFEFAESGEVGRLMPKSVLGPGDARHSLTRSALTTTRDQKTGKLAEVTIEVVNADSAHSHVAGTARLDVTDANRQSVRRWLAKGEPLQALTFLSTTGRPKDVTSPAARGRVGDFDRLLFREGTYSTVHYSDVEEGREFSADATLAGWSFGGATGWETTSRTATGARYLAGPGPGRHRDLVPFEHCAG